MNKYIVFTLIILMGMFSLIFCEEKYAESRGIDIFGNELHYIYDSMGRVEKIEKKNSLGDHLLNAKEIRYDSEGNKSYESHQVLMNNEASHSFATLWTYGSNHQLESEIEGFESLSPRTTRYTYYPDGRLKQWIKPDGVILTFEYSPIGKISHFYSSDRSIDYRYVYDASHRLISVKDLKTNTAANRTYDGENHLVAEQLANGLSLHHRYDLQGRRVALTLPDGSYIAYSYDALFLATVERFSAEGDRQYTHTYTDYDLNGKPVAMEMIGNLGKITKTYDEENRSLSIRSPYWSETVDFDTQGHLFATTIEDSIGEVTSGYVYDNQQQLTEETGMEHNHYQYDSIGNRRWKNDTSYCIDGLNQLTEAGDFRFSYDANGNLIEMETEGNKTFYEYDALNRLITVKKESAYSLEFSYDPFNRRLSQTSFQWDTGHLLWVQEETIRYLYDGKSEIGAVNAGGQITQLRVLGIGDGAEIGAAVAIELDNVVYAPIHNHIGSVCCLVDMEIGNTVQCYRYSAFGEEQLFSCLKQQVDNPWKFCSKRSDDKTGFIFFGERDYNPTIGRWTTKDPLGTPEGVNRYVYALNQPLTHIDVHGLYSFDNVYHWLYDRFKSASDFASSVGLMADSLAEKIFGERFLSFVGFYQENNDAGVYGQGELNDKVRVTLTNGILNLRLDFKESLDFFSKTHGGVNIHYVFNSSEGWTRDVFQTIFGKIGFVYPLAYQLATTWKGLIKEIGGLQEGGLIVHYAHSIGGIHTQAALNLLNEDERRMIRIITFGSPILIKDIGLEKVKNYVSVRDGVCLLDPLRYIRGILGQEEEIIPKGTWLGAPFIDHLLTDDTYRQLIITLGEEFLKEFV